jgi:hypothetical protein
MVTLLSLLINRTIAQNMEVCDKKKKKCLIAAVPALNTIFTDPSKLLTCPHM